jgi:hypothetical protein
MKTSKYINRAHSERRLVMAFVISCLCLSAGEGLRLTPFPAAIQAVAGEENASLPADYAINRADDDSLPLLAGKDGPVISYSRTVKTGRNQVFEYDKGSPSSQLLRELAAHVIRFGQPVQSEDVVVLLLGCRTPSRAPPITL